MSRLLIFILTSLLGSAAMAQLNEEAWANYDASTYEEVENKDGSDVTIIFDRTYIYVEGFDDKVSPFVTVLKTIHRKIKINSLHGLEQFNKLYLPSFDDLYFQRKIVNCKAKTLKKDKTVIHTDTSQFVTSTLPANAPFYYKVDGEVKMLALNDVNIGDEIEYVYSYKNIYSQDPDYFYTTDHVYYGNENNCLEKSLFLSADKFQYKIWPYNFTNGMYRDSDFTYKEGMKISLADIPSLPNEIYSRDEHDEPYVKYTFSNYFDKKEYTWEEYAKDFKASRDVKSKNTILDGQKITQAIRELGQTDGTKERFRLLLDKLNRPVEENFSSYEDVKDEIDIAYTYAQIISDGMFVLSMPVSFHFVISKKKGSIDTSFVSIRQFTNIICSFIDDDGTRYYFPLLEPYSDFNDVRADYQGTDCFTIDQNDRGKRTYSFDKIPYFDAGYYTKDVQVKLAEVKADSLAYTIQENLVFTGNSWLDVKPFVCHALSDSAKTIRNLKRLVADQVVLSDRIDSLYNVDYTLCDTSFSVTYTYDLEQEVKASEIISVAPSAFIDNDFYTPYHLRGKRLSRGYLYDEINSKFSITFDFDGKFEWFENTLLRVDLDNAFGHVTTDYSVDNGMMNATYEIKYLRENFEPKDWPQILSLRDASFSFLNSNLYFQRADL
ncbi:MAG: DUF3857 domain-containing protein [Cryomorphaceae bacterium]